MARAPATAPEHEAAYMLTVTEQGLHCRAGGFHIDPWLPVERALITHAHSDHARAGSRSYLCAQAGVELLHVRLGRGAAITGVPYGEARRIGDVKVSFHPAGHVLGSAQIRLEHRGEVWVVSGDYKTCADPTCAAFEPVRCHTFVTESTFGLPIYRWPEPQRIFAEIHDWWRSSQGQGRTSVLFAYSLGKAQRLLASVDASCGPIFAHGAVCDFLPAYAAAGVRLPSIGPAIPEAVRAAAGCGLVVAPPATARSTWLEALGDVSTAFASGWMLLRGPRRRQGAERGFALSDHADWPGLVSAIRATGAQRVLVTHGQSAPLVRWLNENGWPCEALAPRFVGEARSDASSG
jgi:putative mRNA 3-end processing factor